MFSKTVVVVAIACLIQGFRCETTEDIVKEYIPKIDQLKNEIEAAVNKTQADINLVRWEIGQKINTTTIDVIIKINTLRKEANDALEEAQAAGQDIEACIKAVHASIGKLNLGLLAKCYVNEELIAVQAAVSVLGNLKKNADGIIGGCVEKYPSDDQVKQLRRCLDFGIGKIRVEVKVAQGGIDLALKKAVESANGCVSVAGTVLDASLVQISDDLSNCVESP